MIAEIDAAGPTASGREKQEALNKAMYNNGQFERFIDQLLILTGVLEKSCGEDDEGLIMMHPTRDRKKMGISVAAAGSKSNELSGDVDEDVGSSSEQEQEGNDDEEDDEEEENSSNSSNSISSIA